MIGNGRQASRIKVIGLLVVVLIYCSPVWAKIALKDGEYTLTLADLTVRDEPVMLRGAASEYSVSLPLAKRMVITSARLDLRFVNSISLVDQRSQLGIFINDNVIAQVPLKGNQPEGRVKVRIPIDILKTGYNKLGFSAAQHYSENCEDPASKELWTQIDTVKTRLIIKAGYRSFNPTLAELPDIFDQRLWTDYKLQILTAESQISEDELNWGSLIAQGAALRLNYRPLEVVHQKALRRRTDETRHKTLRWFPGWDQSTTKGYDTVMVGRKEALAPFLADEILARINGAFMGLYPREDNPGHYVLLISGRNAAEVRRAALAFAFPTIDLPDTRDTLIDSLSFSSPPLYSAKRLVQENREYTLAELGYHTQTSTGLFPPRQDIQFWVPPDLFLVSESSELELHLHLAYGAGLGPLSAFNVYLNEEFRHAIHMQQAAGGVYYDYVIRIPMRSLHPGSNTLAFSPYMMPIERSGECQPSYANGLLATLFDDSYIKLADAQHFAALPDLKLFANTLFPYGVTPDGGDFSVQITRPDSRIVSAAWTLLAKMSQILGSPFTQTQLSYALPMDDKHLLVIGVQNEIAPLLSAAAPFSIADLIRAQVPLLEMPKASSEGMSIKDTIRYLIDLVGKAVATEQPEPNHKDSIFLRLPGRFTNTAAATQFESPLYPHKSVITFTAAHADTLNKAISALVKPGLWGSLHGSYGLWQTHSNTVQGEDLGPAFNVGEVGLQSWFSYLFSQHPYIGSALVVFLLIVLVILTRAQLMRYKRRHHPLHADKA